MHFIFNTNKWFQATTTCSTALMNTENDENGSVDYIHASVSSLSSDSDSGSFFFFKLRACMRFFFLDGVKLDSYSESNLFDTSSPFEQGMTKFNVLHIKAWYTILEK